MTIFKIDRDNFENTSIQTSPSKAFSSSSLGVTGSIFVYPRRSDSVKEVIEFPSQRARPQSFDDAALERMFKDVRVEIQNDIADPAITRDYFGNMDKILSFINSLPPSPIINESTASILLLTRSLHADQTFEKKRYVVDNLYPENRVEFPTSHYSYTNYHSLNFFTASQVPTQACLLYPNSSSLTSDTKASGSYTLDNAFTFDFHIKPKNLFTANDSGYSAGTIFHLSSSYALSIISGSSKDEKGNADKFRIQLQLSHSADIKPSSAIQAGYPSDLIFLSDDNSLEGNSWHHVAVKWKADRNAFSGSFIVNNKDAGSFVIPSSSIAPAPYGAPGRNPDVLVVGNYYEGNNQGVNAQSRFFSSRASSFFGIANMDPSTALTPTVFNFTSPLCAELHDLKIYNTYRESEQIYTSSIQGSGQRKENGLVLHVPPFFTKQSPKRSVLRTLTDATTNATENPFNTELSFRVGGHELNIENFTRDLTTLNFPRHMSLTGTKPIGLPDGADANGALYAVPEVRYRNLFLLPCDDGNYIPNFAIVETGSIPRVPVKSGSLFYHYTNDLDYVDLSMIKLRELIPSQSFSSFADPLEYSSIRTITRLKQENVQFATPEIPKGDSFEIPFLYGRTLDNSSNEVSIFDIGKLFYGEKIYPGTLKISDSMLTGSGGQIGITIKDDGFGNLYRADANTRHATWNSVGNIFYDEGILVIKSPNIPLFGKEEFEISFKGQREVHAMKVHVIAPGAALNSSSNPSYVPASASLNANEINPSFVAITGINFHDDNLNVIMKTKFAQPVIKRTDDRVMFKSKLDF